MPQPDIRDASTDYPTKDAYARTDSTVSYDWHATRQGRLLKKQNRADARAARYRQRRARKLLSRAEVRRAAEIAKRIRDDWHAANLNASADRVKTQSRKLEARAKLNRLLGRALPAYREWRALNQADLREADRRSFEHLLGNAALGATKVGWGELPPLVTADMVSLTEPYADHTVETIAPNGHVRSDESFVRPEIGHMVNNIVFRHRNDAWTPISYNPHEFAFNHVALGGSFTIPRAGRLRIDGVMRNIYDKVIYSVRDNFGVSSACLHFSLFLFIWIFRNGDRISLTQPWTNGGIVAYGDDFTFSKSVLDDTTPYTMEATTTEEFTAGETVRILVGSGLAIDSYVDDMETYVNAVLWWQLKRLTVGVV